MGANIRSRSRTLRFRLGESTVETHTASRAHPKFFIGREGGGGEGKTWGYISKFGIATRYGLGGPGIESRWGRDFPHLFKPTLRPTQPPIKWTPDYSRGKSQECGVDHPYYLAQKLKKEYTYMCTPLPGLRCLFSGELCLYLCLLDRASS